MKKRILSAALSLLLILGLNGASAAGSGEPGFYAMDAVQGITVEPLLAEGGPARAELADVDGDGLEEVFWPGSAALRVTVADSREESQYLLLLRETGGGTVYYADQQTGGGPLTFLIRFSLPDRQTKLELTVSSDAPGFAPLRVSLAYTPAAAEDVHPAEPEAPTQPTPGPDPAGETGDPPAQGETERPWLTCTRDGRCPLTAFSDLDPEAWYHDGIHYALERGIMNGYDGGLFSPGSAASRAMLVTILWRMEGSPSASDAMPFGDVDPGAGYAEAIRWAAGVKLVGGYDPETFGPNDPVTREQFAVILWRYIRMKDPGREAPDRPLEFADAGEVSDWADEALRWMTAEGVLRGTEDHRLAPGETATRAQIATMLMRCDPLG